MINWIAIVYMYENEKINVRETALQPQEIWGIYKSWGLHKVFNKGGIPLLVKSNKSSKIKYCVQVNVK